MKKMKKLLSVLLCIVISATALVPVSASFDGAKGTVTIPAGVREVVITLEK